MTEGIGDSVQGPAARSRLNLQAIRVGTRLRLRGEETAEVVANPGDGVWVLVTYLSSPEEPAKVGTESMVFRDDVLGVLDEPHV